MYTEIRELVNFLARNFHLRIPRLKIGLFCEHMANNCLLHFQPYWNINQPKQHEEQRIIRISRTFCDETFTSAAGSVGVLLEELLNCMPDRLILYVNPGEVFYCSSDYSPPMPIWIGSVNEDMSYNEKQKPAALIPPQPLPSAILPLMSSPIQPLHPTMDFSAVDWRVSLSLVHSRELGYECTNPYTGFLMFRYQIAGLPNFTVETFSNTRFGSFRKRPDHAKKFVDAIKSFVNNNKNNNTCTSSSGIGGIASAESFSATNSGSGNDIRGIWSSSSDGGVWSYQGV